MNAFTKTGIELRGLLEVVHGCAVVESVEDGGIVVDDEGNSHQTLLINYAGETDIWWDEQRTVEREGQRVWVDEDGNEYLESEVEF